MIDTLEEPEIVLKNSLKAVAELFNLTDAKFVQKILTEKQTMTVDFTKKVSQVLCKTSLGGLWGWPSEVPTNLTRGRDTGRYFKPHPSKRAKLLVVCPHPSENGYDTDKLPVLEAQRIIDPITERTDISGEEIYLAYAVPFYPRSGKVLSPFTTAFQPILHAEIKRVNPEAILVLGSYALKGLFGAKGLVGNFQGKSKETYNGIPVHYTVDPYKLITNPKISMSLELDLNRIIPLLGGEEMPWDQPQDYKDYKFVDSSEELTKIVTEILIKYVTSDYVVNKPLRISVDTEWGNPDGKEGVMNDVLRYVQFSTAPHTAVTVALTDPDLNKYDDYDEKVKLLKALLEETPGVELCGHNFKVDLIHLFKIGIDCRKNFAFDTMGAYHYLKPQTESIGLTYCALEYSDLGNYETRLTDFIKATPGLKKHTEKHGYSKIPDEVLSVYACKDVDAVMQIWPKLEEALSKNDIDTRYRGYMIDGVACNTQLDSYLRVVKKADSGIFEPEYVGMPVDLELMKSLQVLYSEKKKELLDDVWELTWHGFDPDNQLLKAYLFGQSFCTHKLPDGISTLGLTPTQTTGKYPKPWGELDTEELTHESPATGGDALKLLMQANPQYTELISAIIDYKSINQVVKNFLRPPSIIENEDGTTEEVYDSGLIGCVDEDLAIRGTYLATTETGRFRSLRPNLNNLPGGAAEPSIRKQFALSDDMFLPEHRWASCDSRELVKKGLLDPRYDVIRSCIKAPPGYVIVGE